jgi:hypothetical protein
MDGIFGTRTVHLDHGHDAARRPGLLAVMHNTLYSDIGASARDFLADADARAVRRKHAPKSTAT